MLSRRRDEAYPKLSLCVLIAGRCQRTKLSNSSQVFQGGIFGLDCRPPVDLQVARPYQGGNLREARDNLADSR